MSITLGWVANKYQSHAGRLWLLPSHCSRTAHECPQERPGASNLSAREGWPAFETVYGGLVSHCARVGRTNPSSIATSVRPRSPLLAGEGSGVRSLWLSPLPRTGERTSLVLAQPGRNILVALLCLLWLAWLIRLIGACLIGMWRGWLSRFSPGRCLASFNSFASLIIREIAQPGG